MTDQPADFEPASRQPGKPIDAAFVALSAGLLACLVAAAAGVVIASRKVVAQCPEETVLLGGTGDPSCYDYPQVAPGVAVIAVGVALAVVLLLLHSLITAVRRSSSESS